MDSVSVELSLSRNNPMPNENSVLNNFYTLTS